MSYRLADICNPPSAAQLVQDMHDLNCKAVGLYVVNLSVPSCVQSASYVQAVLAGGIGVLPIVTPGDSPPYGMDLIGAMRSWGAPPCPVAFDIERFSEPGGGWVAQELGALAGGGYFVGIYGPGSDQNLYSGSPFGWRWLADWTFVEEILPPYQAMQWTDQAVAPSGNRYDLSDVQDGLVMWGMGAATTGVVDMDLNPDDPTVKRLLASIEGSNFVPGTSVSMADKVNEFWQETSVTINPAGKGNLGQVLLDILANVKAPPPVDVPALAAAVAAALATHPLTATLSDAEREAVAQHVAAHFVVKP